LTILDACDFLGVGQGGSISAACQGKRVSMYGYQWRFYQEDYPIKIESTVSGGIAKVRIYGLKTDNEYNITIETSTVKSTSKNLIVDSYKVYRQNGKVIKKEKISRDTYKKLN
jgi:hypothetical protein